MNPVSIKTKLTVQFCYQFFCCFKKYLFLMITTFSIHQTFKFLYVFVIYMYTITWPWNMLLTISLIESRFSSMSTDVVADGRTFLLYEVPKMALWILVAVVLLNWPFDSTRKKSALKTVYREIFFFEIHIILLQSKRC